MRLFPAADHPSAPVDTKHFTGAATMARLDGVAEQPPVNVYRVTFQPSARTAWHAHTGVQVLLVIEGRCRIQKAGEPIQEVAAGGAVRIEPGERHWHGATPDGPMTHLALNIDTTTEWFEKVSEAENG
ncbi:MAG: cupin domain-containing protein [Acidobacteria bacterium]|nr:cupin domain-containing protein [Acidobacteriota bacterium]